MKQEEVQKLSDRELLVKTFGKVEKIEGVLGNGGGILQDIRQLQEVQVRLVTRAELRLTVGIVSLIFAVFGTLIYFL